MLPKLIDISLMVVCSCTSLSCNKKDNNAPAVIVPTVKIENASVARTTTSATMHFNITLDKTTTVPVSVDYSLTDGTATAPRDYTAASGTISIPANQSSAEVAVQIKGDPLDTRQDNLEFTIQLSNAKGCTLGIASAKGIIITENETNFIKNKAGLGRLLTSPEYTLVWNDDFREQH